MEDRAVSYVFSPNGLFFSPLGRKSGRSALANRIRTKCIFLGKFMAKAIMDSRMVRLSVTTTKVLPRLDNKETKTLL